MFFCERTISSRRMFSCWASASWATGPDSMALLLLRAEADHPKIVDAHQQAMSRPKARPSLSLIVKRMMGSRLRLGAR
jgi:hypothetical protein